MDHKLSLAASPEAHDRKATKADGAPVPTYLWEDHLRLGGLPTWHSTTAPELPVALDIMQNYCLVWWKRKVLRSFLDWYTSTYLAKIDQADSTWRLSPP